MRVLTLAANNGSIGGGEVMLLQMAESARALGVRVRVIGPSAPAELVEAARGRGFDTVAIDADTRPAYLRRLRAWDRRQRDGLLWCNGLVPALATAGHPHRVVHLHQVPQGLQALAARVARWRSDLVVVPSGYLATQVRAATVMANWTASPTAPRGDRTDGSPARVGFLGRLSQDKGVDVLARAVAALNEREPGSVQLVVAGDYRFVPPEQEAVVRRALSALGDAVTELGWTDRDEFLSQVDAAVFPSVWGEPFGLVVAEAMAARVPFAVSDAGALPEVAGPDHPWVAPAGDAAALASVIHSLLAADPAAATEPAYRRWEREYSPAAGARRFAAVLEGLGMSGTAGG